ncbi:hypothetical protein PENSUB_11838 [Penicillium subrubescens]|uniref:Uncharacterized protein n=1 Tax=Penicillium subrubescens TaxID=1316194 RepID=A0A1Q5T2U3_9EURO|nr:hypothetical protein PENSUB_11838 [Penicillium subrubescens]
MYFDAAYGKEYHDSLGDIWGPFLVERLGICRARQEYIRASDLKAWSFWSDLYGVIKSKTTSADDLVSTRHLASHN